MTSQRQEKHLFDGDGFGEYVIISRGPGAEALLKYEVLFVEPENVQALAQAIGETWNDDYRLKQIAAAG